MSFWTTRFVQKNQKRPTVGNAIRYGAIELMERLREGSFWPGRTLNKWACHVIFMLTTLNTNDLVKELGEDRCVRTSDRKLSISSHVIRCSTLRLVGVGGEHEEKKQISALLDALHWDRFFEKEGVLRFVLGSGKHTKSVLQAITTLLSAMDPKKRERIQVEVDFRPAELIPPDFTEVGTRWLGAFQDRENARPPVLAELLTADVADPVFRWYRTVTSSTWSGRVEGLEVCKIGPPYSQGSLGIGSVGKSGDVSIARSRFLELSKGREKIQFDENSREEAVALIRRLAEDRRTGCLSKVDLEHLLESRILRGDVVVSLPDTGQLYPVVTDIPFQFPTLWSVDGSAKYVDILVRAKSVPWILELKVPSGGGQGKYYRHAIGQAVLYRTFIRQAKTLHPWFENRDLIPSDCRAAVTFPEIRGSKNQRFQLLDDLTWMARLFDVAVVTLPAEDQAKL